MMQSWLVSNWHCSTVEPAPSLRTLGAGDKLLYSMLLILQVYILVRENTKAINKNKFTMTWWIQITCTLHPCIVNMYSLHLATYHKHTYVIYIKIQVIKFYRLIIVFLSNAYSFNSFLFVWYCTFYLGC